MPSSPTGYGTARTNATKANRPEGAHLIEPFKARRNHPLTELEKEYNEWANSIRSVVEHAIGGTKRDWLRYPGRCGTGSKMYGIKWKIEHCFKHLKSNGFRLEDIAKPSPSS